MRAKGAGPLQSRHLRRLPLVEAPARLHLVLLDVSGSMRTGSRLALAKGHATMLIEQAVRVGDEVGLLVFGGRGVEVLIAPRRAGRAAAARVPALGGGGGTPIAEALAQAGRMLQRVLRRDGKLESWLWLLTDGRSLERPDAPDAAHRVVIVDFDDPVRSVGRCAAWATRWGAEHRLALQP